MKNALDNRSCLACLKAGTELHCCRARKIRSTGADGEATVTDGEICRYACSSCGRTLARPDAQVLRNKHFTTYEIQTVVTGGLDYSAASERTKRYWRSWYRVLVNNSLVMLGGVLGCSHDKAVEVLEVLVYRSQHVWLHLLQLLFYILFTIFCLLAIVWCISLGPGGQDAGERADIDGRRPGRGGQVPL